MALDKHLKILQWNCRSLRGKTYELESLLNNYNVACLQETWLNSQDIVRLKNFNISRIDRLTDTHGGGLITAVRNNLSFKNIPLTEKFNGFEILTTEIKYHKEIITVINLYRDHRIRTEIKSIKNLIKYITEFNKVIICGDFNAHHSMWSVGKEDHIGKHIASEITHTNFVILNDPFRATLIPKPQNKPGSPDISAISLNLIHKTEWSLLGDALGGDHLPVSITITNKKTDSSTNREKLNTNRVKWERFKRDLEVKTHNTDFSPLNAIEAYDKINSLIIDTIMEAGAKISKGERAITPKPPWWNSELDRAVEDRKTKLDKYAESMNALKLLTKTLKSKYTRDYMQSLGVNTPTNSIWQMIGGLKGFLSTSQNTASFDYEDPKIKATIDKLCTNADAETTDIPYTTSNHLLDSKITTQNTASFDYEDPKIKATIDKLCTNADAETIDIPYTTSNHHLDSKITTLLEQRVIPKQWTEYNTILIPKPENKSYRPIALASSLLKLLEKNH
ncbi:hypothetical protein TSAR_012790 [Trichomalopsis sarcophagae]|uniref:Endonuclease/exonuclease/phosphatase domain-containing protein n=1 Tax=Trichomalopsis sarcophagae TaxID=543379 RepID=A0A232EI66_9HYME|nr:hypothetical protein TSAR_012790 [Trichomalopsis sarcophagae]